VPTNYRNARRPRIREVGEPVRNFVRTQCRVSLIKVDGMETLATDFPRAARQRCRRGHIVPADAARGGRRRCALSSGLEGRARRGPAPTGWRPATPKCPDCVQASPAVPHLRSGDDHVERDGVPPKVRAHSRRKTRAAAPFTQRIRPASNTAAPAASRASALRRGSPRP